MLVVLFLAILFTMLWVEIAILHALQVALGKVVNNPALTIYLGSIASAFWTCWFYYYY